MPGPDRAAGPSIEGDTYLRDPRGWRPLDGARPGFDELTPCDWMARRHPPPAVRGPDFGPGGDDAQLWGKTEAEAHRWVRSQRDWGGYVMIRLARSDRSPV